QRRSEFEHSLNRHDLLSKTRYFKFSAGVVFQEVSHRSAQQIKLLMLLEELAQHLGVLQTASASIAERARQPGGERSGRKSLAKLSFENFAGSFHFRRRSQSGRVSEFDGERDFATVLPCLHQRYPFTLGLPGQRTNFFRAANSE